MATLHAGLFCYITVAQSSLSNGCNFKETPTDGSKSAQQYVHNISYWTPKQCHWHSHKWTVSKVLNRLELTDF